MTKVDVEAVGPELQCDIDLEIASFMFQGAATFSARYDFLSAFLASVVELGGAPHMSEISEHLLPGVPQFVGRAILGNLLDNGLLSRDGDVVTLSDEGITALQRNVIPQPTNNLWRVRYLFGLDEGSVVVSCVPSEVNNWDLRTSEAQDNSSVDGSLVSFSTPPEMFGMALPLCSNATEIVLSPNGQYSSSQAAGAARVSVVASGQHTKIVRFEAVDIDEDLSTLNFPKQLEGFVTFITGQLFEQVLGAIDCEIDDLTDQEVTSGIRSLEVSDQSVSPQVVVRNCVVNGLQVAPRSSERDRWFLRKLALALRDDMSVEEWRECAEYLADGEGYSGDRSPAFLRKSLASDLSRRAVRFTDQWWASHSSLDWELS